MSDSRDLQREMREEERRERKVILCDVLLCDPPHIDMFAYTMWLNGYSGTGVREEGHREKSNSNFSAIEGTAKKHTMVPFQSPQDMKSLFHHSFLLLCPSFESHFTFSGATNVICVINITILPSWSDSSKALSVSLHKPPL
jgi:hypothetical protein